MFKKPLSPSALAAAQDRRIDKLRKEVAELDRQVGNNDAEAIVKEHIQLLHSYNEIKDGTQALIGRYAVMTNGTVKDIHQTMGLSLTE